MDLKKKHLWTYNRFILQSFNGTRGGYIDLLITVEKGRDVRMVDYEFLVVHCKRVYNSILGRSFAVALDVVASLVHPKLMFHNLHDEKWMIRAYYESSYYKLRGQISSGKST